MIEKNQFEQYHSLIEFLLEYGDRKNDRTGTGTISTFGHQMRFDLRKEFPLLTTKKIHFKSIVHELLWFIRGDTNISYLQKHGVKIWNEWADENGELGPIYGKQWRAWETADGNTIDQLSWVINEIQTNPDSRRLIINSYNVGELSKMKLPPCHSLFQFYVNNGELSCQLYQRSADVFLGLPFNIASYSLLTMMIAQICNLKPGEFVWSGGDIHIYTDHIEQCKTLIGRRLLALPTVTLNPNIQSIFDFKEEDITLNSYNYHPPIKAPVSV